MGLVSFVLTLPVSAPLRSLVFIADKLAEQAGVELLDESVVEQQLMELELRLAVGEVGQEEYEARESELLGRLEAMRVYKEQMANGRAAVERTCRVASRRGRPRRSR